jgi:hypothetical protein
MEQSKPYIETFLRQLTPGTWYPIASIPRVIGLAGIIDAARRQILLPEYEIIIGKFYATFKIVRAKTETMKIIERIEKTKAV